MKILLMGPVGSGKGTQGEMLSDYLGIPLVSVGQALRNVPSTSPLYEGINQPLKEGSLVPQHLAAEVIKELISHPGHENGYILDGWGRTPEDLVLFDPGFDYILNINISEDSSVKRLSTRRTCSNCGKVFNIETMPPKVEDVCDECGGRLIQREDDTEEAIKKRLEIYKTDTRQTLDLFKDQGKLIQIDGEASPVEVFDRVKKALKI